MSLHNIVITTGNPRGIGLEITAKALVQLSKRRGSGLYYIWRSANKPQSRSEQKTQGEALKLLDAHFYRHKVNNLDEALKITNLNSHHIVDIASPLRPACWVEHSAQAALKNKVQALVTGPMSKNEFQKAGFKACGHTQFLKQITGASDVFMMFLGARFNTLLLTEHISLAQVPQGLTSELVYKACKMAYQHRAYLQADRVKKPLALVALNPHAGEGGLLGAEEKHLLQPAINRFKDCFGAHELVGPLVPDVAFQASQWSRYSMYICPYHDQALIPFKAVHSSLSASRFKKLAYYKPSTRFLSGAQTTLGLTFVRTSVDHGVASDIWGHNKADCASMCSAILWAEHLLQARQSAGQPVGPLKSQPESQPRAVGSS